MSEPHWWYWLILGVILMSAEMRFGTWYVFWFGVSSIFVGALLAIYPGATFGAQIFLWLVLAATLILTHSKITGGDTEAPDSPRRHWPNRRKISRKHRR
jgi:membrane protein implicated in regulation of membrane protease activity